MMDNDDLIQIDEVNENDQDEEFSAFDIEEIRNNRYKKY